MRITVVGTGYVGLVTGACLADVGNNGLCLDVDENKLAVLERGDVPFHEPGLADIVRRNYEAGRLQFTSDAQSAALHATIQMDGYRLIIDKSTVPVGTVDRVTQLVSEELKARGVDYEFAVV